MERIEQLLPLSMEHHLSLSLAIKAIRIAEKGDAQEIKTLCEHIIEEYPQLWRKHFDKEERYIFTPYADRSESINQLCKQLILEHNQFNQYIEQMKNGNFSILSDFGKQLKAHTRMEERELFPLISEKLSQHELDMIYQGISSIR